jgi:hypothetical protein
MHRIPSAGFWLNFLYIVFSQTAVPAVVVFLLFVYLSKDTIEFRIGSYFPLLCSFYAVYLPYHIMAGSGSAYSFFELFLKPLMYLAEVYPESWTKNPVFGGTLFYVQVHIGKENGNSEALH